MDMPSRPPSKEDLQHILHYTLVALIGMLGGIIVGYTFGHGAENPAINTPKPAVTRQHNR